MLFEKKQQQKKQQQQPQQQKMSEVLQSYTFVPKSGLFRFLSFDILMGFFHRFVFSFVCLYGRQA